MPSYILNPDGTITDRSEEPDAAGFIESKSASSISNYKDKYLNFDNNDPKQKKVPVSVENSFITDSEFKADPEELDSIGTLAWNDAYRTKVQSSYLLNDSHNFDYSFVNESGEIETKELLEGNKIETISDFSSINFASNFGYGDDYKKVFASELEMLGSVSARNVDDASLTLHKFVLAF